MSGFEIVRRIPPRPRRTMRILNRTPSPVQQTGSAVRPKRTPPNRCPLCGNHAGGTDKVFVRSGDTFRCRICDTVINSRGEFISIPK